MYKKYSEGWLKIPKRKLEKSTTLESFFCIFFKKKQHKMEKCSPNKYKFPYFTSLQRVVKTTLLPNILFLLHGVSALLFLDTLPGNHPFPNRLSQGSIYLLRFHELETFCSGRLSQRTNFSSFHIFI